MMKVKKVLRYIGLGIFVILAMCAIPVGPFLSERREMDRDPEVKTELVEGSEQKD